MARPARDGDSLSCSSDPRFASRISTVKPEAKSLTLAKIGVALALLLTGAGCQRQSVQEYRVTKETADPHANMAGAHGHGPSMEAMGAPVPKVEWTLPDGWRELPAGRMRAANFAISGADDQEAEVAVIPLPGMSAADAEVVNLWRDQLQLKRWTADDIAAQAVSIDVGDTPGRLFDLVSEKPLIDDKYPARTLVAMLERERVAWFFKMTGPEALLEKEKPAFVSFLKSIRYLGAESSAAAPSQTMAQASASAPAASPADPGKPSWSIPSGWRPQPPPPMAMAGFSTEGDAAVSVTLLEGTGGGTLPNVNRWRGQIKLAPIDDAELERTSEGFEAGGLNVLLVDMSGTSARTGKPTRVLGAIIPQQGRTWFYKLQGDDAVVGQEKARFVDFVKSARYPNG
jgi:hypothetical protein